MEAEQLKQRLARYFARIPHVHTVAFGTSWSREPPVSSILLVMDAAALDLPLDECSNVMAHAQDCALRAGRLFGARSVRSTILTPAVPLNHLLRNEVVLYTRQEAP